jgi:hypothetical protein
MLSARDSQLGSTDVSSLMLKVEQNPEFKTWIRDGKFDSIVPRLPDMLSIGSSVTNLRTKLP